jgi:acyl phosphate:glycerol-3-phosphate acyltransferase
VGLLSVAAIAAAYIIGSLPTGYAIARLRGIDLLRVGSGHTGATNVLRSSGLVCAFLTAVADLLKGYAGVQLTRALIPEAPWVLALSCIATVLGHNRSVFLGFAGGVGSMTTFGAALAISPTAAVLAMVIGAIPLGLTRYASLGSVTMAVALPVVLAIGAIIDGWPWVWVSFGLATGALSLWELRPNIGRLLRGEERKIGQKIPPGHEDVRE